MAAETAARQPFFAAGQPFSGNRGPSPYYTLGPYLAPGPRGVIGTGEGHCFFFFRLTPDSVILALRTADLPISAPGRTAGTVGIGERRGTVPAMAAETAARQPFCAARQPFLGNRGTIPYYTLGPYLAPGPRGVIGTGEGHCFFFFSAGA